MISDLMRSQSISIMSIEEISIFLVKMFKHVTEIVRNVTFIISEICMLVIIVIQARLISSSDTKNMCSKK